jgi:signal peptide peptidase SppA
MSDYGQIITKLQDTPWMITEGGLRTILQVVNHHLEGHVSLDEIRQRTEGGKRNRGSIPKQEGAVGLLPLHGPIFPKANLMTELSGATSMEQFQQDFRAMMLNDRVSSILLDIDSPGGSSFLVREMADEIREARDTKPIYAVANAMAASAAYMLASSASELYASPSSFVGSVGTYYVHTDDSELKEKLGVKETVIHEGRFKAALMTPLTPETRAHIQQMVADTQDSFVEAVALGRNTTVEDVSANYGEGGVVTAKRALEAGMVDGVNTFDEVLTSLLDGGGTLVTAGERGSSVGFSLRASLDKELEHSEPGTGSPPQPRTPPEDEHIDDWKATGARLQKPPGILEPEEGTTMDREQLLAFAKKLGISNAADLTDEQLSQKVTEGFEANLELVGELQKATAIASEEVEFAQKYPEQADRLAKLEARDQEHEAIAFANSLADFNLTEGEGEDAKITSFRLSTRAQEVVKGAHLSLSKGELDHDALKQLVAVVATSGVQQGEVGSSRQDEGIQYETHTSGDRIPGNVKDIRTAFAAKVTNLMKNDNMSREVAMEEAARQNPELAAAYMNAK